VSEPRLRWSVAASRPGEGLPLISVCPLSLGSSMQSVWYLEWGGQNIRRSGLERTRNLGGNPMAATSTLGLVHFNFRLPGRKRTWPGR
jgi:hypothetical protein